MINNQFNNQHTETRRVQRNEVRRNEVHRNIVELAQSLELKVTFSNGKRQEDVVVMHVQGAQQRIKAFYAHIDKLFPHLAIELFNLDAHWFGLVAAVVDTELQSNSKIHERRNPTHHHYLTRGD